MQKKVSSYRRQEYYGRAIIQIIFGLVAIAAMITSGRLLYLTFLGKNPVVVITSPADAKIKLNGKELGKAPLTVELRTGQYILEAEKTNYETVQHGIYVSAKASNVVNIQMISTASAGAGIAGTQTNGS